VPRIGHFGHPKPIELVGQFLSGPRAAKPTIVQVTTRRAFDLAVEVRRASSGRSRRTSSGMKSTIG
jgi:hypothetical protein